MTTYDYNTGKPLAPGQAQSVYNTTTGQKIGSTSSGSSSGSSGGGSSGGGGGGSSYVAPAPSVINIDSNPSQTLAPGQLYTYKGVQYTQPGATVATPTISSANLKVGSTGQAVKDLQTQLGITADGIFGPQTDAAVKAYQSANSLTPDGVVGVNTSAKMNNTTPTAPATKPVEFTVPDVATPYEAPKQDTTQIDSYLLSLPEQNANAQMQIDNARQQQLDQNQQNQQREQQTYDDAMASENTAIQAEQKLKLDTFTLNMDRYNKAYNDNQGLLTQLNTLTTQGNALILAQKSTTGLTAIRSPRVNETISEITGAAAILQTAINANEFDMTSSNNIINTAMSAITSTYQNTIDYYQTIADVADKKLIILDAAEQDFMQVTIDNLQKKKDSIQTNVDYIQKLMITPESASFMAKAGVSLLDSPQVINQKMSAQTQKDELTASKNEMVTKGYTYVPFPTSTAGLTPITAGGQTMWFKAPVAKAGTTSSSEQLSPTELANLKEQYPDAGLTFGDTDASAAIKISNIKSPEDQMRVDIQTEKDKGATLNEVISALGTNTDAINIAKEVYKETTTPLVEKPKYAPVGDTLSMPSGNTASNAGWNDGFFNGVYNSLFN